MATIPTSSAPWRIGGACRPTVVDAEGKTVCMITPRKGAWNGTLIAEAPAMLVSLRRLLAQIVETSAWDDACAGEDPKLKADVDQAQALVARITGTPTASAPTGEFVMVRADHLAVLIGAAESYVEDIETGVEGGYYEERGEADAVKEAIAAVGKEA